MCEHPFDSGCVNNCRIFRFLRASIVNEQQPTTINQTHSDNTFTDTPLTHIRLNKLKQKRRVVVWGLSFIARSSLLLLSADDDVFCLRLSGREDTRGGENDSISFILAATTIPLGFRFPKKPKDSFVQIHNAVHSVTASHLCLLRDITDTHLEDDNAALTHQKTGENSRIWTRFSPTKEPAIVASRSDVFFVTDIHFI